MEKYGIIYKIQNKIDDKVYIGQTTRTFKERYGNNLQKGTRNTHLKSAIEKYGIENFEVDEEFDVAYSKEELDEKEIYWIAYYNATDKEFGYNFLSGGHRGKHNEESKRKIGDKQRGVLNHMYGKRGKDNPNYSRIAVKCDYCGKEIEIYKCLIDRSKYHYCSEDCRKANAKNEEHEKIDISVTVKCSCCGKEIKRLPSQIHKDNFCSKECQIEYLRERNKGENNPNYGNHKVKGGNNGRAKKVICIETGEIFECARDADAKYGMNKGRVSSCCRGEQKTAGGFHWKYYE